MRSFWGIICILFFFSCGLVVLLLGENEDGIHVVSVGQGDGIFIEYKGRRFIVDVGKDDTFFSFVDEWIEGDRFIDGIFISHNQYDHIGGISKVMRTFPVGFIAFSTSPSLEVSSLCRVKAITCLVLHQGDSLVGNGVDIKILWPPEGEVFSDLNEGSLVLQMNLGGVRILFTGDISASIESRLVEQYGDMLSSHVLKVPHHGSSYSSTPYFVKTVSPLISVVSVGENTYGHPSPYMKDIMKDVGATVFETHSDGTIHIRLDSDIIEVITST